MDLYSGSPYWIVKNPLYQYFNPLRANHRTEVAVIGGGIPGALVANELCRAGIGCTVIDKRSIATGSSCASTALLQYEIDTPLVDLIEKVGEDNAVKAYHSCLDSITDIENVFKQISYDPSFLRVPSLYLGSNENGYSLIQKEYAVRKKYGLPVEFLNSGEVKNLNPGTLSLYKNRRQPDNCRRRR